MKETFKCIFKTVLRSSTCGFVGGRYITNYFKMSMINKISRTKCMTRTEVII